MSSSTSLATSLCSVEDAADRVCTAANWPTAGTDGGVFEARGFEVHSSTGAVEAAIKPEQNPGANDSEWLCSCSVHLEGSPEEIGKQLAAIHALLNRPPTPPNEDDSTFYGFVP